MKKNIYRTLALILAFFVAGFISSFFSVTKFSNSNIIIISLDGLRADKLISYGFKKYASSRFLNNFSREAVQFTHCFSREPDTQASHRILFTGRTSEIHDKGGNAKALNQNPGLPAILKKNGYHTAAFVDRKKFPRKWRLRNGFDVYNDKGGNFKRILRRVNRFIENRAPKAPFFLFVHTGDMTSDEGAPVYRSPKPFRGRFSNGIPSALNEVFNMDESSKKWNSRDVSDVDRKYLDATYAESLMFVDRHLGKLFKALKKKDLYDKSIIVITSGYGEGLFDHESWTHDELYDHTIKIPLLIKLPKGAHGGRIRTSLMESIDIAPTLLELLDLSSLDGMEGISMVPAIEKNMPLKKYAFSMVSKNGLEVYAVRTKSHKYIHEMDTGKEMFFNLLKDPQEEVNIADTEVEIKNRLKKILTEWMKNRS